MDLEEWSLRIKSDEKTIVDVSASIIELLKGVDRVTCVPSILANIYESLEHNVDVELPELFFTSFRNNIVDWGMESYAFNKVIKSVSGINILYDFCVLNGYDEDNTWGCGSGDRTVCYIKDTDKRVLLFENQNIKFVLVIEKYQIHIREVFLDIEGSSFYSYSDEYFDGIDSLRKGLKGDKGLEIAVCNLTGKWSRFTDVVEGNKYPDRINLKTMKGFNFDKTCSSFRYGDNRDSGYLLTIDTMFEKGKCELNDINKANYAFEDVIGAIAELPKSYIKIIKRDNRLSVILGDE